MSIPRSSSRSTSRKRFANASLMSGVAPDLSVAPGSAPRDTNRSKFRHKPRATAPSIAGAPFRSRAFGSAPCASRMSRISSSGIAAASVTGESLLASFAFGSAVSVRSVRRLVFLRPFIAQISSVTPCFPGSLTLSPDRTSELRATVSSRSTACAASTIWKLENTSVALVPAPFEFPIEQPATSKRMNTAALTRSIIFNLFVQSILDVLH